MTITASITTQQTTSYIGQTWYDMMGNPLDETGHAHPQTAAQKIADLDKALAGKWCFALVKTKVRENGIDRWATAITFPDGKSRKLVQGEVAANLRTKGKFLTFAALHDAALAAKARVEIRRAPDTRFPWHQGAAEAKLSKFTDMLHVERWLSENTRPDTVIFIFEPGQHVRAPDEEILFAYLAVVQK